MTNVSSFAERTKLSMYLDELQVYLLDKINLN